MPSLLPISQNVEPSSLIWRMWAFFVGVTTTMDIKRRWEMLPKIIGALDEV
jgi:hypothetical protein